MDTPTEKNQCGQEWDSADAEKASENTIFATEEIIVEEIAIDGICGVY